MGKIKNLSRNAISRKPEAAGTEIERKTAVVPKTAGAASDAPDTSRSAAGNRDPGRPRKAGASPKPRGR